MIQSPKSGAAEQFFTLAALATACAALSGCGGSVEPSNRSGGEPEGLAESVPDAGATDTGSEIEPPPRTPQTPPTGNQDDDEDLTPFVDPGCPDEGEPGARRECDPFVEDSGCPEGLECFPYVNYPNHECASETFGTRCRVAGVGRQGDSCTDGGCAGGFLCVASGRGTVCAQLCALPGENICAPGLICGSVDIEGFGVCF